MIRTRWLLAATAVIAVAGCSSEESQLRAKRIESRFELVGGPVGMAEVGDFLLENDQIRVAILGPRISPGPGVFGGSLVDADLRRPFLPQVGGLGSDRFAETFPLANLLVPDPKETEVEVLSSGADGRRAAIRVSGEGGFIFEAIGFLDSAADFLGLVFPDLKTKVSFRTDYILEPGDRFVTIRTIVQLPPPDSTTDEDCPFLGNCPLVGECDLGFKLDENGCFACSCEEPIPLTNYTESTDIFKGILGDPLIPLDGGTIEDPVIRTGVVAGDFVFFGNQNDIFGPGMGYDEEKAVFDAIFEGRDTFQSPLSFDYAAASGGDISYAYFTVAQAEGEDPVVNVPIFTSAATAFLIAVNNCLFDEADDAVCDRIRTFEFERYLALGEGDVASAAEVVFDRRGTPVGEVRGSVRWKQTGAGVPKARIFLLRDPDPARVWNSLDEVVEANLSASGQHGIMNVIDADRGIDTVLDGVFRARVQAGAYIAVARTADGMAMSVPHRIDVAAGGTVELSPLLDPPATVLVRIADESGSAVPAKIVFQALDESTGEPLELDGRRRPYLGDSRFGDGVREVVHAHTGEAEVAMEPGRYRILVTRGPEYSRFEMPDVTLSSGQRLPVDALVGREIDSQGWASVDMHLHARPSFDSGMPLERRVRTAVVEGLDMAVATDHDVLTDYRPALLALELEPWLKTAIGAEVSTLELGHYIGWPMAYDNTIIPDHGTHDWTCETGNQVLEGVRSLAEPGSEFITILAHPRDGFIGYVDQLGVDPFTMQRQLATLNENNVLFQTAACGFDAMEVFNSKRFDLIRTPTVGEVMGFNVCLERINQATNSAQLDVACPELEGWPLATCRTGDRFFDCQQRHRSELAWEVTKLILARTPAEDEALANYELTAAEGEAECNLAAWKELSAEARVLIADRPCTHYSGHVDDFHQFAEYGYTPTQVGSSDGHGNQREPGTPRTYFKSPADSPADIEVSQAARALKDGEAFTTYGPYIRAEIRGKSFGEVVSASAGEIVPLQLQIETASWFGIDRVEVYVNGRLFAEVDRPDPNSPNATSITSVPEDIVDVSTVFSVEVPDRDSWITVVAMGLEDKNLLGPTTLSVPFGELQLPRVAALALAQLGAVAESFISPSPPVPDWFPIPAFAYSNPIYLDVDGNGQYDAPNGPPPFCSQKCNAALAQINEDGEDTSGLCPPGQVCLPEGRCGILIEGDCQGRLAMPQAMPDR